MLGTMVRCKRTTVLGIKYLPDIILQIFRQKIYMLQQTVRAAREAQSL